MNTLLNRFLIPLFLLCVHNTAIGQITPPLSPDPIESEAFYSLALIDNFVDEYNECVVSTILPKAQRVSNHSGTFIINYISNSMKL